MDFSFSPISYTPKSQSTPPTGSTMTPEEQIDQAEKEALQKGGDLPKEIFPEYRRMVQRGFALMRDQIFTMRSQGIPDFSINLAINGLLKNFHATSEEFLAKNQSWDIAKGRVSNHFQVKSEPLKSLSSDFSPIKRLTFDNEKDPWDEDLFSCMLKPKSDEKANQAQTFRSELLKIRSIEEAQASFQQKIEKKEERAQPKSFPIEKKVESWSPTIPKANENLYSSYQAHLKEKVTGAVTANVMESKKAELAHCVRMSMELEYPGAILICLQNHLKGVPEDQQDELYELPSKAVVGGAITKLAAPLAAVQEVVGAVLDGLALGAVSGQVMMDDPANYQMLMQEVREVLAGKNPAFNQAVHEMTPDCIKKVNAIKESWNDKLKQIDDALQKKYQTPPGIVEEGIQGAVDIGVGGAAGLAFKGAAHLIQSKQVSKFVVQTPRKAERIAKNVATDSASSQVNVKPPLKANQEVKVEKISSSKDATMASKINDLNDPTLDVPYIVLQNVEKKSTEEKVALVAKKKWTRDEIRLNNSCASLAEQWTREERALKLQVAKKQKDAFYAKEDRKILKDIPPIRVSHGSQLVDQAVGKDVRTVIDMKNFISDSHHLGNFRYQRIKNDILIFFPYVKFGGPEAALNAAVAFTKRQKYERIFFAWDPETHSMASVVKQSKEIIGVGTGVRGEFTPFTVVEIANKS